MRKTVKLVIGIGLIAVIFLGIEGIATIEASHKTSGQTGAVSNNTGKGSKADKSASKAQALSVPDNQTSPDFLTGTKFAPAGLTIPDNTYVFDSRKVDVTGDGIADDVVLTGEKQGNNPYVQNISVAVKNGFSGKFSMASIGELNSGLDPKLFIGSFTNAKNHDILVSLATGGSGGVYQFGLLTYRNNQVTSIVSQKELNQGLILETQCLSGFSLKVTDKMTGYKATIDLHKGTADYEKLGIYDKNGNLLKDPMVLIDGYSVLKPVANGDGVYELHGIQRISVAAHVNSVANAESVWAISNGKLKLVSEQIEPIK